MTVIEPRPAISFSEFVAWEAGQAALHELINGTIVPFRAGSADHELITGNVFAKLHATVEPPCRVFPSTTIVQTANRRGKDGYRPDVTVSCSPENIGRREFSSEPRIVVEVTSPSNAGRDWDLKLFEYSNTQSIEQLVLIGSLERETTSYLRAADGQWLPPITFASDGVLTFSLGVTLTFGQIYRNTSLQISA
jgi:Uma2 family endonuclease